MQHKRFITKRVDIEKLIVYYIFYIRLYQSTHMVSEKFKQFVTYLRRNCVTNKCDAANILRKIYDTESFIECELIACAQIILYTMRYMKNKLMLKRYLIFSVLSYSAVRITLRVPILSLN